METIFSFNFWKAASIVSLGEAKNGFIFGVKLWLRVLEPKPVFFGVCGRLFPLGLCWKRQDASRVGCPCSTVVLQAWFRQLSSEINPLPQAALWWCIHELTHAAFQASRRCNGTAEVLPSVSKVAGVWRSLSWCLESVMLWRGIMGFIEIWWQACQWFGIALRLCSWSRMLATGNSMQVDLHTPRLPYVLIIYSLPVLLSATLCSSSFCCIFICTNLKQTLLMSARSSFHWGMSTFLVTPLMCCVFICTNSRHTLKTSLWRLGCEMSGGSTASNPSTPVDS